MVHSEKIRLMFNLIESKTQKIERGDGKERKKEKGKIGKEGGGI